MSGAYIAIIPARGGSLGVPRKNLEIIGNQSLLARAINCAKNCESLLTCVVSSDDEEILTIARSAGVLAHRRSIDASSDHARASQVVIDYLEKIGDIPEETVLVYLQPTSPFRTQHHVAMAIKQFDASQSESLVSVVGADQYMEKTLLIDDQGFLRPAFEVSDPEQNRQVLPMRVYPNGAIYIFTVGAFRRNSDIPVIGSLPFMMGKVESIDIDDPEDLIIARAVADSAGI